MKNCRLGMRLLGSLALMVICSAVSAGDAIQPLPATQDELDKVITVEITGLAFVPAEITIPAGTRVRWVNTDPIDHDVTSGKSITGRKARGLAQTKFPNGIFSSGLFGHGKPYEHTFQKPGEYPYYCNIHPFMTATVKVE